MSKMLAEQFGVKISPTQLLNFKRCKHRWYRRKVLKESGELDRATVVRFAVGRIVHKALELFFNYVEPDMVPKTGDIKDWIYHSTLQLIPDVFREDFKHHIWNFAIIEAARWNDLGRFIRNDFDRQFRYWKPVVCEERVDNDIRGLNFVVDRVDRVPPGWFRKWPSAKSELCIVDYKTGRAKTKLTSDYRFQLNFYAHYMQTQSLPKRPMYGSIVFTNEPIRVNCKFHPATQRSLIAAVKALESSYIEKKWPRSLSRKWVCKWCDHYLNCWSEVMIGDLIRKRFDEIKKRMERDARNK